MNAFTTSVLAASMRSAEAWPRAVVNCCAEILPPMCRDIWYGPRLAP